MEIAGTGSWKTFTVADQKTGELLIEKKFYKADFDQVMNNPEYSPYIDTLLESALVRKLSEEVDIDVESYEEIRAVSMEMSDNILDPEA